MVGMAKILLSPLAGCAVGGVVLMLAVHPLLPFGLEPGGKTAAAMADAMMVTGQNEQNGGPQFEAPKFETPKFPWEQDQDATIIANLAIGSLRDSLLKWLTSERGVHAETLLVSIGALAGFAAPSAAFRSIGPPGTPVPKDAIVTAEAGGETYYFGDRINGYLVRQAGENRFPLWGYIAAAALEAGLAESKMPDVREMFGHVAKTVGTPDFGIPRAPKEHPTHLTPRKALEAFWPGAKELLSNADGVLVRGLSGLEDLRGTGVAEEHWPLVIALVARQFIIMAKDTLDPRISLSLVMESAIAMSKVDPKTIPQERGN
jgi:hypothetical protein